MRTDYKHDVFISYWHEDEAKIKPLYEKMSAYGLRVFWSPKTLERGVAFPTELGEAVLGSQHCLVYWSQRTSKSKWVTKEYEMFLSSCHLPDKAHRRMYVLLEESCTQNDLPGLLRELNRPASSDDFVVEVVRTVLNGCTEQCHLTATQCNDTVSGLQKRLDAESRKVQEAQRYYRHSRFWWPFADHRDVHIFTCARDVRFDPSGSSGKTMRGQGGRTNIDMWDYRAVLDITHYFASNYPNAKVTIEDPMSKLHDADLQDSVRLADHMSYIGSVLEDRDCIIIGSPDVSDFAELVLARIHKISPYTEGRVKNRGFAIIKDHKYTRSSFYWQRDESRSEQEGIAQIIGANKYDHFPHVLGNEDGVVGKMHGILIVANNPFGRDKARKIIILSGFSGVATNAIAKLLTDDQCLPEFYKLDNAYVDTTRDMEGLIGVRYVVDKGFTERDTRRIQDLAQMITFEKCVEL